MTTKLVIKVWHDDCPERPDEGDGWTPYSFSSCHSNHKDPEEAGFEWDDDNGVVPNKELQGKLDTGLAFKLSYFEHGECVWSLSGEGPQCRWDSTQFAGLLVWDQDAGDLGPESYEDRKKDAAAFIKRYTQWCNGEIYGYTVEAVKDCHACGKEEDAKVDFDLPSVGGYYIDDIDGMVIDMKDHIGDDWTNYKVRFEEQHAYGVAEEVERLWKGDKS